MPWKSFRRAARRTSNSAQPMHWNTEYSLNQVHTGAHRNITLKQLKSLVTYTPWLMINLLPWACSASLLAVILVYFLSVLSAAHSVALSFSILVPAMPLTNVINTVWTSSICAKFVQVHLSVAQDCFKFQ